MSVTDIAYCVLKGHGKPLHFKELIQEILKVKPVRDDNPGRILAQMHTEINLDARFVHQGGGEWGLRDWQPKSGTKVVRIRPATAPPRMRRELLPMDDVDDANVNEEDEEDESRDLDDADEEVLDEEDED